MPIFDDFDLDIQKVNGVRGDDRTPSEKQESGCECCSDTKTVVGTIDNSCTCPTVNANTCVNCPTVNVCGTLKVCTME